jgi:radical SAM protein with 4Fe4S-binding SPASM domain
MALLTKHIGRLPVIGNIYRRNYYAWKRAYANFLRGAGLRPGPIIVSWVATNRCNSNCVYCEARANEEIADELTTKEIKELLDELGALKVKRFFVIGGEPMVRKDLFDVLGHARLRGMSVGIFTNSLLTRKYSEAIRKTGLDNVWTSVDGLAATHDKNRGYPKAYEITLDAIRYYTEIGIPTRVVNTLVHPENFGQLDQMFEELKKAGMNWWRLGAVMPVGRARNDDFSLSPERTTELFEYVKRLRREFKVTITEEMGYLGCWEDQVRDAPFICHAGLTFCAVMPNGDVVPCQTDHVGKFSEGNVRQTPFSEIWRTGFRVFRQAELDDECVSCQHKRACSGGCWITRANEAACLKHQAGVNGNGLVSIQ